MSYPVAKTLSTVLASLLLLGLGSAQARTVRIIQADNLEMNTVDDQDIVVISGERVELHIDDDVVVATRVEFNRTHRTLTLVGQGRYDAIDSAGNEQHMTGENLVVNLGTQALTGEDVIISDSTLQIRGEAIERVPGRLSAQNSYFTPCARCGRTPNDYAFKAARLLLYPGDRLIAYQATLLLADAPVLYLPVIALPLNDATRQPKFSYASDAVDGRTIKADLPFALGSNVLGTTLLRHYQNRQSHYGFGTDFTVYTPMPYIDKINGYFLALPKPITAAVDDDESGYNLDYTFGIKGRYDLENTVSGLSYTLTTVHREIDLSSTDTSKGVTFINGGADVTYTNVPRVSNVKVNVTIADRRGPEPTTALSTVLKKPEITVDPDAFRYTYRSGSTLSADFKITVGNYMAASNPLNRTVSREGPNFATWRLQEEHRIAFNARPWLGGDFMAYNNFVGKYYLSGQRAVDLDVGFALSQTFGLRPPDLPYTTTYNSFGTSITPTASLGNWVFGFKYLRREGVGPFSFDRLDSKRISAPINLAVNLTPTSGVSFKLSQDYDIVLPADQQSPADFAVSVAREPLQLNLDIKHDFFHTELESVSASGSYGAQAARGLNVAFSGSYTRTDGPGLLTTSVKVIGGVRTNNVGVSVTSDLKKREVQSVTITGNAVRSRDTVLNPVTLSASETINLQSPHADGSYTVNWRNFTLNSTHSLTLPRGALAAYKATSTPTNPSAYNLYVYNPDTVYFSVGNVAGSSYSSYGSGYTSGNYGSYTSTASSSNWYNWQQLAPGALAWNLKYGGPYDLSTQTWTKPALTLSLTATRPAQRLSTQATLAMPGSQETSSPYLQAASVGGDWQFNRRAAISGLASYSRRQNTDGSEVNETLNLQPLAFNFAFGPHERPDAYLTATFQQTLTWQNGLRTSITPFRPILLLTVDRCCWAFQAEVNPLERRFRIGFVLPGAGQVTAFENTTSGNSFPVFSLDGLNKLGQ